MRQRTDAREVHVVKDRLIEKIKENKDAHIKEYNQAVIDYKEEAHKQLQQQLENLKEGKLNIELKLVTPIDNRVEYDKIIQVFEWDVNKVVILSQ